MKKIYKSPEVVEARLYGQKIGDFLIESNRVMFSYDGAFRQSALEISPFKLPLKSTSNLYTNSDEPLYQGLAGVFADSLPDAHGSAIVENYFLRLGIQKHSINALDRLSFVGNRGMGAIEYAPIEAPLTHNTFGFETIHEAYREVKALVSDVSDFSPSKLLTYIHSASALGGAHPKMLINHDPRTNALRFYKHQYESGYVPSILKFHDSFSANIEYAYMQIAAQIGIDVAKSYLIREENHFHFITQRFDRDKMRKIHTSTLSALTHKHISVNHSLSYNDYYKVAHILTRDHAVKEEIFLRMVFNVLGLNQDDHGKNMAFLMDEMGIWRLASAYDLTFSPNGGHTMTINGYHRDITKAILLEFATKIGIEPSDALVLIERVKIGFETLGEKLENAYLKHSDALYYHNLIAKNIASVLR